jgi:hypothetical protein
MVPDGDSKAPPPSDDRRLAPRYPAQFAVEAVFGFGAPTALQATSVSQSGIFLIGDQVPSLGDRVTIRIDLPYASVKLIATVKRIAEFQGFAVQIDRFDEGEEAWTGLVRTARMRAPG